MSTDSATKEFEVGIRVAGRAVEYWGSQSISSDTSAIFELVKNSRDADATRVEITFEKSEKPGGRIIVKDNGVGMTMGDIDQRWLVAGTDYKIRNTETEKGRRVWGEMGIGRFSCERLAKKTRMISCHVDENETIIMDFDWEKYKHPSITFDQVKHKGYVERKNDPKEHGLTLILEDLRSAWNERKIRELKKELGTFVLPNELKGPEAFEIIINASDYHLQEEQVGDMVTKIAPIKMKAEFDGKETTIKISDFEVNKGQWQTMDPISYQDEVVPSVGPLIFELYFYPLDSSAQTRMSSYYEQKLKDLDIKEFLREYSGIYLYRDGVWLKPLGRSNDWLGLEARRVQRGSNVGLSRVLGIVRISQNQNPSIRPTAHRETLQDNDAFQSLKKVLLHTINVFDKYRKDRSETKTTLPSVEEEEMARNNIGDITRILKRGREGNFTRTDIEKMLSSARATNLYIEKFTQQKAEELQKYGELRQHEDTVFTIGLLTSYMAHEVAGPINNSVKVLREVRQMMTSADSGKAVTPNAAKEGFNWLDALESDTNKILHFISFVNVLSQHVAISASRGGKKYQTAISDAWHTVTEGFKNLIEELSIDVIGDINPPNLKVKTNRIDLESVLANMLLNTIQILAKKKEGRRLVKFAVRYTSEGLVLNLSDNGKGISRKHIDRIFEPFFTVEAQDPERPHGLGLGLAIVKKILDRHNGNIEVRSPGDYDPGTTFTIRIPTSDIPKVI